MAHPCGQAPQKAEAGVYGLGYIENYREQPGLHSKTLAHRGGGVEAGGLWRLGIQSAVESLSSMLELGALDSTPGQQTNK